METPINVNKEDYSIEQFIGGQYGICKKGTARGECVFGGDSACEDHYNKELMEDVFNQWDGTLHYHGENYGYKIEE